VPTGNVAIGNTVKFPTKPGEFLWGKSLGANCRWNKSGKQTFGRIGYGVHTRVGHFGEENILPA